MVKFIWFLIFMCILISGCTAIGLGIGILEQESPEYRAVYHLDLLEELEPGTKLILEFNDGKKVKGAFQYFEEYFEGGYDKSDSNYNKGLWEISIKVNNKNITHASNEIRAMLKFIKKAIMPYQSV